MPVCRARRDRVTGRWRIAARRLYPAPPAKWGRTAYTTRPALPASSLWAGARSTGETMHRDRTERLHASLRAPALRRLGLAALVVASGVGASGCFAMPAPPAPAYAPPPPPP